MTRRTVGTLAMAIALVATAWAQPSGLEAQDEGVLNEVPHQQTLTANPFLLLLEWFNAEYERKISGSTTVGVSGSFIRLDGGNDDFFSANAQVRYYPQGAALVGFYVGPRLGYYRVDSFDDDLENALGLGFDIGYNWLLGSERHFAIGLGIGLSRIIGLDSGDTEATIPTVRLVNLGWAF